MKFAVACYGTRGDVEPSVAVGRELLRRGHDVRLAVPPDLVDFVEAAGLATVSYGPVLEEFLDEDFLRIEQRGEFDVKHRKHYRQHLTHYRG